MTEYEDIRYEVEDAAAIVTIDRPPRWPGWG
jgi:1,4-dihydroxy-2-naphthoyl-CoA synthase